MTETPSSVRKYTRLHAHAVQDPEHLNEALTRKIVGQTWSSPLGRLADMHKLSKAGLLQIAQISPDQWLHSPEALALAHLDPRPPAQRIASMASVHANSLPANDWNDISPIMDNPSPLNRRLSRSRWRFLPSWRARPHHILFALCGLAFLLLALILLH